MSDRTAADLRAEIEELEAVLLAAWERDGEEAARPIARKILDLNAQLEQTTVPVTREDIRVAAGAVERWAKECVPASNGYLLGVAARLRDALGS